MQLGFQKGIEKGIQQGALQKAVTSAKILLEKKIPAGEIAEITGLSIKEIEKFAKDMKK